MGGITATNGSSVFTDSDAQLECVDGSDSRNLVSELRPDIQEPVERAGKHISNQEPLPNDVGSSLGGMTQINDQPSQNDSHRNDAISSLGCVTQVLENTSQVRCAGGSRSVSFCIEMHPKCVHVGHVQTCDYMLRKRIMVHVNILFEF